MSRIFTRLVYHAARASGNGAVPGALLPYRSMSGASAKSGDSGAESEPGQVDEAPEDRPGGPVESFFSELIRRSASLGFSSLLLTEEAVRRAFSDKVPPEWVETLGRQGEDLRRQIVDRVGKEFGQWLRTQDAAALVQQLLERYEVSAQIELRPIASDDDGEPPAAASLRVTTRPR